MTASSKTTRRSWIPLTIVTALFIVFIGVPYLLVRPAMPRSKLSRLAIGMTKDEIRTVLGEPHKTGENYWEYSRFGNQGWVEIHFDDAGRLVEVNDESVFP